MSPDIPWTSYLEQKRQLTQWKKTNPWLKTVHSQEMSVGRSHYYQEQSKTNNLIMVFAVNPSLRLN